MRPAITMEEIFSPLVTLVPDLVPGARLRSFTGWIYTGSIGLC